HEAARLGPTHSSRPRLSKRLNDSTPICQDGRGIIAIEQRNLGEIESELRVEHEESGGLPKSRGEHPLKSHAGFRQRTKTGNGLRPQIPHKHKSLSTLSARRAPRPASSRGPRKGPPSTSHTAAS